RCELEPRQHERHCGDYFERYQRGFTLERSAGWWDKEFQRDSEDGWQFDSEGIESDAHECDGEHESFDRGRSWSFREIASARAGRDSCAGKHEREERNADDSRRLHGFPGDR